MLSVTVRVPARVPVADGVKITLIEQLPVAERIEPQVLAWLKSPVTAMPEIFKSASPVLLKVTCCALLGEPIDCAGKPRLAAESEA